MDGNLDDDQIEEIRNRANEAVEQLEKLKKDSTSILQKHENLKKKIDQKIGLELLEEFNAIQKSRWLIIRLTKIKNIHLRLNEQYESLDIEEIIDLFQSLLDCCTELFKFNACEFDIYANNVLVFWKNKLTTRLSEEFTGEYFTKVKWPKIPINKIQTSRSSTATPFQSIIEKFKLYIKVLIVLSSADTLNDKTIDHSRKICYPMRLMLEPVKDRCIYHFMVSSKTNVLDKPEWYMNLAIKWIDENSTFIQDVVDPIVGGYPQYPGAYLQFVMGMIELVGLRLKEDLSKVLKGLSDQEDFTRCDLYNRIFVQIYSELMLFIKEIRSLIGDSDYFKLDDSYDLLSLLIDREDCMRKILKVERSRALELMESIFSSETCWKTLLDDEFDDKYKITECADRFMLMIQSISERLESFRNTNYQHQLVELQCDLFDKFLKESRSKIISRQAQFVNEFLTINPSRGNGIEGVQKELRHPYFYILNNVDFLRLVLRERSFLAPHVVDNLNKNPNLVKDLNDVSARYKYQYDALMENALDVYDGTGCELNSYLEYIRPKIPKSTYEHLADEAKKRYQEKRTKLLFSKRVD